MKNLENFVSKFLSAHATLACTVAIARKEVKKSQGKNGEKKIKKNKGPYLDSQALRTRSMDKIQGIEALDFGLRVGEVLSPTSSLQQLQQQSRLGPPLVIGYNQ